MFLVALGVLAAALVGCGGDDEPISFGEGKVPASVPADFPVPNGAVVGSTLTDRVNHRTEFAYTIRQEATLVVQYYTVSLVSAGYVVNRSEGDMYSWRIQFSRGELRGDLVIQPGGSGLAAVVVSLNTS